MYANKFDIQTVSGDEPAPRAFGRWARMSPEERRLVQTSRLITIMRARWRRFPSDRSDVDIMLRILSVSTQIDIPELWVDNWLWFADPSRGEDYGASWRQILARIVRFANRGTRRG